MTDPPLLTDPPLPPAPVGVDDAAHRYEVVAAAQITDEHDQVLKDGESFAVFDRFGDIRAGGLGEEGIYHRGTRHLSALALRLAGGRPLLLGSTARTDNSRLAVDLTNAAYGEGEDHVSHSLLHVARSKVLIEGECHERLVVRSFARRPVRLELALRFAADFADIFEVRGMLRGERGVHLAPRIGSRDVLLRYRGLDGVIRRTRLAFSRPPDTLDEHHATFVLELPDVRAVTLDLVISCETGTAGRRAPVPWEEAGRRASRHHDRVMDGAVRLSSSSELLNEWIDRSLADLAMLTSRTGDGLYPYAGVPWFSAPFGRDGIVAALQSLWITPRIARGVLTFLAARQADTLDPARDAQPGKILHELREGEMAAMGEVPFGRYYGSHDATPLFVMLAAAYWRQTDDTATVARLWPHVERAIEWMRTYGDRDGDGLLEYGRDRETGLEQQGWKDSWDSVFHADGSLADGPIALCEIQAYAYGAYRGAAELADALGHPRHASELRDHADALRSAFDAAFWDDELGTFVLALDRAKRPCRIVASNAGHALLTGIALPQRAPLVADALMGDAAYSGWGIRTVAAGMPRYNPMSYHDGSIWPHDNALIGLGMARYGFHERAARLLADHLDASRHFDLARLPELFCGFTRRPGEGPTRYPVACSPQAWAAGAAFMLLQAALGLEVDAPRRRVRFRNGRLPDTVSWVSIDGLRVGDAELDLVVERKPSGIDVRVTRRRGIAAVVAIE
jgi:glycogen debranching enzyme